MKHEYSFLFPEAPEGGGYLVFNQAQISDWDLVCLAKSLYPQTKIIAQQRLPTSKE